MKEIERIKTLSFNFKYDIDDLSIVKNINLEFVPDEIILKHISIVDGNYSNDSYGQPGIYKISTNLIDNEYIISFPPGVLCESFNIPYDNHKRNINGQYYFNLGSTTGENIDNGCNLNVSMILLFVKYKN